ncbi:hypothetical protein T484DRAFT_1891339 [Baffinella frigidus]|nr:hypothetical protein T484DRAFT_1891339 [Cryptophyta sp. CCMP2293]
MQPEVAVASIIRRTLQAQADIDAEERRNDELERSLSSLQKLTVCHTAATAALRQKCFTFSAAEEKRRQEAQVLVRQKDELQETTRDLEEKLRSAAERIILMLFNEGMSVAARDKAAEEEEDYLQNTPEQLVLMVLRAQVAEVRIEDAPSGEYEEELLLINVSLKAELQESEDSAHNLRLQLRRLHASRAQQLEAIDQEMARFSAEEAATREQLQKAMTGILMLEEVLVIPGGFL